jgi:glycosyltransferase involved in cell wall biosynthesis
MIIDTPTIEVIGVCYQRFGELKVFVQSWLNQSLSNWKLKVIHDGPSDDFERIMQVYQAEAPERVHFECSPTRFNDYGHSLRDLGLKSATGDYILLTNCDNYFIPKALEFITEGCIGTPDVVLFDMVHSHDKPGGRSLPSYSYFQTAYEPGSIDVSSAVVRRELASAAGFRDKGHDGDAVYFMEVAHRSKSGQLSLHKIHRVLFVHN